MNCPHKSLRLDCKVGDLTSQIVSETRGPVGLFSCGLPRGNAVNGCTCRSNLFLIYSVQSGYTLSVTGLTLKVVEAGERNMNI